MTTNNISFFTLYLTWLCLYSERRFRPMAPRDPEVGTLLNTSIITDSGLNFEFVYFSIGINIIIILKVIYLPALLLIVHT